MKLQVVSDVHLENDYLAAHDVADLSADVVVLSGDIHRGLSGVRWAGSIWTERAVVYVPGNHEAYGFTLGEESSACRAEATGTNVRFVDNETVIIHGVRFIGTRLWTDFSLFGSGDRMRMAREVARDGMNDYRAIRRRDRKPLRPEDTQAMHVDTLSWLDAELAQPHPGPTVVVTHHAPHWGSLYKENPYGMRREDVEYIHAAYASDLSWLIDRHEPCLWIHGHTHRACSYLVGSTRIVSNPRGNYGENTGWDPHFTVDLDSKGRSPRGVPTTRST